MQIAVEVKNSPGKELESILGIRSSTPGKNWRVSRA